MTPPAQYLGGRGGHGLQAGQGFFRLEILDGAQHGIEQDDSEDNKGALSMAGQQGHHGGDDQNEHQQILELLQKNPDDALLFTLCQGIGAAFQCDLPGLAPRSVLWETSEAAAGRPRRSGYNT